MKIDAIVLVVGDGIARDRMIASREINAIWIVGDGIARDRMIASRIKIDAITRGVGSDVIP